MATSGTFAQTVFTTQQVIDHAYRRTKIPPQAISGEKIDTALELLWLILNELSGKGVPVWKTERLLMPLVYNTSRTTFTEGGVVKVIRASLRILQRIAATATSNSGGTAANVVDGNLESECIQAAPDGAITLDFGQPAIMSSIGILPGATGTWTFTIEVSEDNVSYSAFTTYVDQPMALDRFLWRDITPVRAVNGYRYIRVRALSGTTLRVKEIFVGRSPSAIEMTPYNYDEFLSIPNRVQQGRPVCYWQDFIRQDATLGPNHTVLRVWPVPDVAHTFAQIEAHVQRVIQDVGELTQELNIPPTWFEAIVASLAEKIGESDPDFKGDQQELERKAKEKRNEAWAGITPAGPIKLQPNISYYTRG